MKINHSINCEKIKHILYLISIFLLLSFSLLVFFQSTTNYLLMDYLEEVMSQPKLTVVILFGAILYITVFLLISKVLSALSSKKQLILTAVLAGLAVFVQYFLLFHIEAILRYDHLRVFDAGLEILNTTHLSLTANDGYYGLYPFNISIATFNSIILRIVKFIGISERYYLLSLQSVYLFLIDLGVFFTWQIVRILHSVKRATLFAILCITNPMLYVCFMGCYTTTLMLPLLMGTLLAIICFLKEQNWNKKIIFGVLAGISLGFGSRLRATIFIAGIAFAIYLLIRQQTAKSSKSTPKKFALLTCALLLGALLGFGGFTAYQNTFITEDYTDTQMPAIYYLMFAILSYFYSSFWVAYHNNSMLPC